MTSADPHSPITVLMPAYQEGERIAATVSAARTLPGVTRVLVIDDGSTDETAVRAAAAGAEVLRLEQNGGKGVALRAGLAACPGEKNDIFLLIDADVGATAAETARLLVPVQAGEADLAIACFPKATGKVGFGLVKGLARWGTWLLTRQRLDAPISGQRAVRRWVLEAAPIPDDYGMEVAMNIAAGDVHARIVEVPVEMTHNATGRTLAGFKHRGRQFQHIFHALLAAACGRTGLPLFERGAAVQMLCWLLPIALLGWLWADHAMHLPLFRSAVAFTVISASLLAGLVLALLLSGLLGARRRNFAGRFIPALGGLFILPVIVIWLAQAPALDASRQLAAYAPPIFLLAWMLLGLLDDLAGNAERKGFRGHVSALLHGRFTTGAIKLLGGGLLALGMGLVIALIRGDNLLTVPVTTVLIALSANAMNLFDLRPGRALKVFWLIMLPLVLTSHLPPTMIFFPGDLHLWVWHHALYVLLPLLLLASALYAPLDFAGMAMLGDTGANPLGALLGFVLAVRLPLPGQIVAVLLLIALHIYAERASITQTITRVPLLRWLDELGR